MNPLSVLDKLGVICRRDLLSALRYRSAFGMRVAGMLAETAAFYYLAHAVGPGFRPDGVAYFPFLLVGMGFQGFLVRGVNTFVSEIRDAQTTGTIEVLMTTATAPPVIVILTAFSVFAGQALHFLLYLLVGFLLFGGLGPDLNLVGGALVLVLSFVLAIAVGILAAAAQVSIQKGGIVVWLLSSLGWFMTGTMFPVAALPVPLQWFSAMIPFTHALDGLRKALLLGTSLPDMARPLTILALYAIVLPPLSVSVFSRVLRRAKARGTLSSY